MRYYRRNSFNGNNSLLEEFNSFYKIGAIYPEGTTRITSDGDDTAPVEELPKDFEEVPAGEYFVQEGKMPEYFAIKRVANNPLWGKYINWLNKTYNHTWNGDIGHTYYGYADDNGSHGTLLSIKQFREDAVELTLEQWDKIINKNVMEEGNKEIIGWKLTKPEYTEAAQKIANTTSDYTKTTFITSSIAYNRFKEAGVLELWFTPVYKEKTLQFGGYDVTFEKVSSGVRITCNGETGTFSQIEAIYNYFKPNSTYFKFGSQEVKSVTYINGSSWNLDLEYINPIKIKIGCTTGTWEEFVAIYKKAKSML